MLDEAAQSHDGRADEYADNQFLGPLARHHEECRRCGPGIHERALGLEDRRIGSDGPGGGDQLPDREPDERADHRQLSCPDVDSGPEDRHSRERDRLEEQDRAPRPGEVPAARPSDCRDDGGRDGGNQKALDQRHEP